ncbi:MAG: DEAD/DEAH box helicase family protein [Planctomycetota bacterium]
MATFAPKHYQSQCLDALRDYFRAAVDVGAKTAFIARTERPYHTKGIPESLRGRPYVCLRVPTGGGKTLLAAYAIGEACREFLRMDRCAVLWLAPTNTIVSQTLKALRDRQHPYRQALNAAFGGNVEALSMSEALYVTRGTLDGATTIIVSTLAALRVEETEGRKVYESNGALDHHFSGLSDAQMAHIEKAPEGVPIYSLANVLRLRCPVVIMDEAHNARTTLSFAALERFSPACIIEFTATPDQDPRGSPSNVLYSVSAAQLKAEKMVKLPIRLVCRPQPREAVQEAVNRQRQLENVARAEEAATGEYIRPIVLFQAQNRGQDVPVAVLKSWLTADFHINEEEIAIATGDSADLPDDINNRTSRVRYVITVSKLREGWDCPFAYVLCSVSNLSSRTAVEQILGRVLRLPRASKKQHDELNVAYAYATSQSFGDAADSLTDALIESGFEKFEARRFIETDPNSRGDSGTGTLFGPQVVTETETLTGAPNLATIPADLRDRMTFQTVEGEAATRLIYTGVPLTHAEASVIQNAFTVSEDRTAIERLFRRTNGLPIHPAALGVQMRVPCLAARIDGAFELFDDQFRDVDINLRSCDPSLSEAEFTIHQPAGREGEIDINEEQRIEIRSVTELRRQLTLNDIRGPRTDTDLVVWLDREFHMQPDSIYFTQAESSLFVKAIVDHLLQSRRIPLAELVTARFRIRDAILRKIDTFRAQAGRSSYQQWLLRDARIPLETTPEICFEYPRDEYPAHRLYNGRYTFPKHYYVQPAEMNDEEARCALIIDGMEEVLCWVRNLVRQPMCSFWLPTSSDRFYPDFVAKLHDGRYLVVEYKGEGWIGNPDSSEKADVGDMWAARSNGKCVFRLVGTDDMEASIKEAVA